MADAILGGYDRARKSTSTDFTISKLANQSLALPGLIDDALIDATIQVAVLGAIDKTGSSSLVELMALLPQHPRPADAVLGFVRHGVLSIDPGLLDGNSLLRRRIDPSRPKTSSCNSRAVHTITAGPEVVSGTGHPERVGDDSRNDRQPAGGLRRLKPMSPQPDIFFATGQELTAFMREPRMRRGGVYLALFGNAAYSGRSGDTASRIAWGAHLRQHGLPDLVIAAVDRSDCLSEAQIKVVERQLARAVLADPALVLSNKTLPDGAAVTPAQFAIAARFTQQVVTALRDSGLAFTRANSTVGGAWVIEDLDRGEHRADQRASHFVDPGDEPGNDFGEALDDDRNDLLAGVLDDVPGDGFGDDGRGDALADHQGHALGEADGAGEPMFYRLSSCGVVAQARVENDRWIVLAGSQIRAVATPSAGTSAARQRQELIYDGDLVKRGGHLVLMADLTFDTASGAANFVVGSRHKPEIWRPCASPFDYGPRL